MLKSLFLKVKGLFSRVKTSAENGLKKIDENSLLIEANYMRVPFKIDSLDIDLCYLFAVERGEKMSNLTYLGLGDDLLLCVNSQAYDNSALYSLKKKGDKIAVFANREFIFSYELVKEEFGRKFLQYAGKVNAYEDKP